MRWRSSGAPSRKVRAIGVFFCRPLLVCWPRRLPVEGRRQTATTIFKKAVFFPHPLIPLTGGAATCTQAPSPRVRHWEVCWPPHPVSHAPHGSAVKDLYARKRNESECLSILKPLMAAKPAISKASWCQRELPFLPPAVELPPTSLDADNESPSSPSIARHPRRVSRTRAATCRTGKALTPTWLSRSS